jgi:hypothetical protein
MLPAVRWFHAETVKGEKKIAGLSVKYCREKQNKHARNFILKEIQFSSSLNRNYFLQK